MLRLRTLQLHGKTNSSTNSEELGVVLVLGTSLPTLKGTALSKIHGQ